MFKLKTLHKMLIVSSIILISTEVYTQENNRTKSEISVVTDTKHDTSIPLRYIKKYSSTTKFNFSPTASSDLVSSTDPSFIPLTGFQGLGVGLGNYQVMSETPDPVASVGMTQYVQWVNNDIAIFDKHTGALKAGFPKPANSLWTGFGGPCEQSNIGQATVKYDQLVRRWLFTQIAYSDINGPYYQCIAVSNSEDATGTYSRYAFPINGLPDHSKLGLWRDGYYLALNLIKGNVTGPQACVIDRDKILAGQTATMQCQQLTATMRSPYLLPIDLSGEKLPPAGNPGYFIGLNEPLNLFLAKMFVDFVTPSNTHVETTIIPVKNYVRACDQSNGMDCAEQPNTTNRLNTDSNKIKGTFVYRQYVPYGSIVVNHTVEGAPPKYAPSIKWYEMRLTSNNTDYVPVVYQDGLIQPDSKNRYIGSIAIDRFTNIAVGYTVSSSLVHPSPELGIHNYNDDLNYMKIQPLVTGRGSQINGHMNWGSTSSMAVDPIDECTFWYTGEYLKTTGSLNWSTYILKFKLKACV